MIWPQWPEDQQKITEGLIICKSTVARVLVCVRVCPSITADHHHAESCDIQYACVYIYACLFCLLSPDVFRQSQTQHFLSHLRTTNTQACTHVGDTDLVWQGCNFSCADSLGSSLSPSLSLSLSLSPFFLHPTLLAYDHRVVYINCCLEPCLFVSMWMCVFAILPCICSQG